MRAVRVLLTPDAEPFDPGAVAVIVDVLRATSTLSHALANGAAAVHPVATPEEARAKAAGIPGALLCGERDGRLIPGFDLGNSPVEYSAAVVSGRPLVFASTNGSIAMVRAARARRRVLAAFVNAHAALEAVAGADRVTIVCGGKLAAFSLEDAAFAGWMVRALEARGHRATQPAARIAAALAPESEPQIRRLLEGCSHGRYLRALGGEFARDVERCARLDVLDRAFEI